MCECIAGFARTVLIILLLPAIMMIWLIGVFVFIIISPCYCIGYCCCHGDGCGYMCLERTICHKWLRLPCTAFEWACSCCCGDGGHEHHSHKQQKMKKPKAQKGSSGPKIPKADKRDKVYYAPRDGPNKENYVAKTGAMS